MERLAWALGIPVIATAVTLVIIFAISRLLLFWHDAFIATAAALIVSALVLAIATVLSRMGPSARANH